MSAAMILGSPIAAEIRERETARLRNHMPLQVAVLWFSERPESKVYLGAQEKLFASAGVRVVADEIPSSRGQSWVLERISALNRDPSIAAVSVHQPLPARFDTPSLLAAIDPRKDLEGTHPANLGMLSFRDHHPSPCAARAAVVCLMRAVPTLQGKSACIIGRSALLGRPLAQILLQSAYGSPTLTICHRRTTDLSSHTRTADVLISAAGKARLVTPDMVRPGTVVIDAGINVENGKVVGDVDPAVKDIASAMTPVPGGVGPVCTALLLTNLAACVEAQLNPP